MRRLAWSLAAAALAAGCAPQVLRTPAVVTLFGPEARLETWSASVVERVHTHAALGAEPCQIQLMNSAVGVILTMLRPEKPIREDPLGRELGRILDGMCEPLWGRAHGGPSRMVLALRRVDREGGPPSEALLIDLPLLAPQETERTFLKDDFAAEWERPPRTREAVLESGRVHVRRLPDGGYDLELFLVLRPLAPGAAWERLQVVARVEVRS